MATSSDRMLGDTYNYCLFIWRRNGIYVGHKRNSIGAGEDISVYPAKNTSPCVTKESLSHSHTSRGTVRGENRGRGRNSISPVNPVRGGILITFLFIFN